MKDEEIEELSGKPDSNDDGEKRKLSTDSNPAAKKIILNRNSIIEEVKVDQPKNEDIALGMSSDQPQKRIIKLSELGTKEVRFRGYLVIHEKQMVIYDYLFVIAFRDESKKIWCSTI